MRVADERRVCRAGDIVVVPPDTLHDFRVVTDVIMEVIAEQDIGTFWPVRRADGTTHLVQVYTLSPWNPPPQGGESPRRNSRRSSVRSTSTCSGHHSRGHRQRASTPD